MRVKERERQEKRYKEIIVCADASVAVYEKSIRQFLFVDFHLLS